jgi:hypothetical protein
MYCDHCKKLAPVRRIAKMEDHYCRTCKRVVESENNRIVKLSQEEAYIRGLEIILQRGA